MYILLILAAIFTALEAYATRNGLTKIEYFAKPAVMVCLFVWLYLTTGLKGAALWFGMGILFSLIGDVLLLGLDRMFLYGLIAFLCAHIAYIIGFKDEFAKVSFWSVILVLMLGLSAVRVMRRIISAMRAKGQMRLAAPVVLYSMVITVMLLAAMLTLTDLTWKANASLLAAAGAFLFYISDVMLAWNKFVAPIKNGRMLNIALYHAGQIMLVAGVVSQFG